MATIGNVPGFPRWVGARTQATCNGPASILLTVTVPPVRGYLYGLWLQATRRLPA